MTERRIPEDRHDPAQRASHDDREEAAEQLREAAGDGRIDLDELEERLERVFAAKTYGELEPLTADLRAAANPRAGEPLVLKTQAASIEQVGHWVVPRRIGASAVQGNITIDFTGAVCDHREVALEVDVQMGTLLVIVPRGWSVRTHSARINVGAVKNRATEPPAAGCPVLDITGDVALGSVQIRYPRGWRWRKRRG